MNDITWFPMYSNKPRLDVRIYVGYDPKEQIAHDVCVHSIRSQSNIDVKRLYSKDIPQYNRNMPNEIQSTDFTFTRFLVPELMDYKGFGIYVDSDFLFLKDPLKMLEDVNTDNTEIALWVVKHPEYTPKSAIKMNNLPQHTQYRKNWCSLIIYNNAHPIIKGMCSSQFVNTIPRGKSLHELLLVPSEMIGEIPLEWNTLDGYYYLKDPHAIHYTDGGPWHGKHDTTYAHLWSEAHRKMLMQEHSECR